MSNLKLGVEVVSAHDLLPKEQGTANAFVEVEFDDQKFRTAIKDRDLNPVWNEQFYFNISAVGSKTEAPPAVRMFSAGQQQPVNFRLKETSPTLGGGRVVGSRVIPGEKAGAYDLVEKMQYLFVRMVKARDLPHMDMDLYHFLCFV